MSNADPIRLVDDPNAGDLLRADLQVAGESNLAFDVESGLQRFESATLASSAGTVGGLKIAGWFLGAVVLVAGAAWFATRDEAPSVPVTEPIAVAPLAQVGAAVDPPTAPTPHHAPSAPVVSATDVVPPVLGVEEDAPAVETEPRPSAAERAPTPVRHAKKSHPQAGDRGLADAYVREADQLDRARRNLDRDPAATLRLAEAGHAEFPNGALKQEREGLAILALVGLDRVDEARSRAKPFLDRHPRGTVSARIERALAER